MITSDSTFSWSVFQAVIAVWVLIYFCVWKGVNSSSNIVWLSVPVPIIFVLVMVIKGVTLPGAGTGLKMYLLGHNANGEPSNWGDKFGQISMWAEAAG